MKKVLAITLVVVLALALSATALASGTVSVSLGAFDNINSETQKGWTTAEQAVHDGTTATLPWAVLKAATSITIRISNTPVEGSAFQFTLQSPDNWWSQHEWSDIGEIFKPNADGSPGGSIEFSFSANPGIAGFRASEKGKIIIAYYDDNLDSLGITSATLHGIPGDLAEELGVPTTGVLTFMGIAAGALAVSGTGVVVVGRKLKKK